MKWKSEIKDKYFENGNLCISVEFTNGSEDGSGTYTKIYQASTVQEDGWLDTQITNEVNRLNQLSEWDNTKVSADVDVISSQSDIAEV